MPLLKLYARFLLGDRMAAINGRYGAGGALTLDHEVAGVTQEIPPAVAEYYGGKHFVFESASIQAARAICKAMGWNFIEEDDAQ